MEVVEHAGYRLLGIGFLRRGAFFDWRDQEPAELLLAVGTMLFLVEQERRARAEIERGARG